MIISVENRARLAFLIVVILAVAATLVWHERSSGQFTTYQILTRDSVSGLIVDAPVEFHGVEVGKVTRIDLTGPDSVSILAAVKKDAPVTAATVATITDRGLSPRGFTGYVYISLEDSGTDHRPLATAAGSLYPVIPAAPLHSASLDTAIAQVNQNVQLLTDLLRTLLDEKTIASFKRSVDSLQKITRTLAQANDRIDRIIVNADQASARLDPLLEEGSGALAKLEPLLDSSHDAVNALRLQVLPEVYRAIGSLNTLTDSMRGLIDKIDRNPSILVRGSVMPRGPGEDE
jgi:phospholipid/cholesterol/gamma-HCH transport system substrate-binding protein